MATPAPLRGPNGLPSQSLGRREGRLAMNGFMPECASPSARIFCCEAPLAALRVGPGTAGDAECSRARPVAQALDLYESVAQFALHLQ